MHGLSLFSVAGEGETHMVLASGIAHAVHVWQKNLQGRSSVEPEDVSLVAGPEEILLPTDLRQKDRMTLEDYEEMVAAKEARKR